MTKKDTKELLLTAENNITAEAHSEDWKISKMELFPRIVNGCKFLTIFEKSFTLDVWHEFEYTSVQLTKYDK